ncbi:hypothetical protein Fmac_016743 [Flemingia macrophylla]|uniref:Uncharacterized protein n=1 Tax=Flemingia macrophylla TaxID=520843 RepID=A0ABD1MIA6_9FABA
MVSRDWFSYGVRMPRRSHALQNSLVYGIFDMWQLSVSKQPDMGPPERAFHICSLFWTIQFDDVSIFGTSRASHLAYLWALYIGGR